MPIRSVGIIGAGTMGSGIAQLFASTGFDVVITDVSSAAAEKGWGGCRSPRAPRGQGEDGH